MSVFDHSRDFLKRHYVEVEKLRRAVWEELEKVEDELELWGELKEGDRTVPAWAAYDGKVLRVVIDDYLPKKTKNLPNQLLNSNWAKPVKNAVAELNKKLGFEVRFNKILAIICIYLPREGVWDPDNRAISKVINALRYAGVAREDNWHELAFMVIGRPDKQYPRTEVYVVDQDQILPAIRTALNTKEETSSEYIRKNSTYPQPPTPTNEPPESWW